MPTESSVVSALIRQVHTRRLATDPVLFGCTKPAQPEPIRRTSVARPSYPLHPRSREERRWPLVLATVVVGAIGVLSARYVTSTIGDGRGAAVVLPEVPAPAIATAPTAEPIVVAAAAPTAPAVVEPPPSEPAAIQSVQTPARRAHTKSKRVAAKKHPIKTTPVSRPAAKREPSPPPPPPAPAAKARQAADSENPL
jgi:hypothetical protein